MNVFTLEIATPYEGSRLQSVHLDRDEAERQAWNLRIEGRLWEGSAALVREVPLGVPADDYPSFTVVCEVEGMTFQELRATKLDRELRERAPAARDGKVSGRRSEIEYYERGSECRTIAKRRFNRATRQMVKTELRDMVG